MYDAQKYLIWVMILIEGITLTIRYKANSNNFRKLLSVSHSAKNTFALALLCELQF